MTVTGGLLFLWLGDVAGLLRQIRGLVYPGQVFLGGGGYPLRYFAASFLEFGMTEDHYPPPLGNASEASGFLFLLPLLLVLVAREIWQRRYDRLLLTSTAFLILLFIFMNVGLPPWLAHWNGLGDVSGSRAHVAMGVGVAMALCRYFSLGGAPRAREGWAAFAGLSALLFLGFHAANIHLSNFVSAGSGLVVSLFFALLALQIWQRQSLTSMLLLCLPLAATNALVNPLARGLPGFSASELLRATAGRPGPWLVLGRSDRSHVLAQFLKASGAEVLGGVEINPRPAMLAQLDPAAESRGVYSRYAHISFVPQASGPPRFELTSTASYEIGLTSTDDTLARLGVQQILAVDLPAEETARIPHFHEVATVRDCRILARDD